MERNGIVEEELRSVLQYNWKTAPGEVPMEGVRDIGEHEGGVAVKDLGKMAERVETA